MFINYIEDEFSNSSVPGVDIYTFKLSLIMYADDIAIFADTQEGLHKGLDALSD